MEKKKWIKPEFGSAKLYETRTECDCGATLFKTPSNEHHCHRENLWHRNNCMSLQ